MSTPPPLLAEKSQKAAVARPPRDRLLLAARDLFGRYGIRAVSVDAIAEAAQTNKMTLYRHFDSKDLLVAAYLQALEAEGEAGWAALAEQHRDDPEAQLFAWLDGIAAVLASEGERGCAFANAAVELTEKNHPARAVIERHKTHQREVLADLAKRAGYAEPGRLADEIVLMLDGARINIQSVGPCGPGARLVDMIRTLIKNHAGAQ